VTAERDFKAIQHEFCAYLRDPAEHPPPPGVAPRRLALYRELVYRNVEDALARALPVLRTLLDDGVWQDMVGGFLADHRAHTPLYSHLAEEFLIYLADHDIRETWPTFLLELARYEWSKAQVLFDPRDTTECAIETGLALVDGRVVLNPVLIAASYRFPVHRLGPGFQAREAPATPSYLVVWRRRNDSVGFMELNAVAARLLHLIALEDGRSGAELLELIALELKHPTPAAVIEGGREILQSFLDQDIALGAR
jgi:uncharacterized protein